MIKKTVLALFLFAGLTAFYGAQAQGQSCAHPCLNQVVITGNRVIAPRPPYFAIHPPVYYDRIVRRAYGISPYAVPPGVMPVENTIPSIPKAVSNPFYKGPQPAKSKDQSRPTTKSVNHSTRESGVKFIANPYCAQPVAAIS